MCLTYYYFLLACQLGAPINADCILSCYMRAYHPALRPLWADYTVLLTRAFRTSLTASTHASYSGEMRAVHLIILHLMCRLRRSCS